MTTRLQLRDQFLSVLQTAMRERDKRPEWKDLARDFYWALDYASKFALYCAELAMGENEVRP